MVLVVQTKERLLLLFDLCEVPVPLNDVVFVLVVKHHLRVHKIFNDLFPAAILQKLGPGRLDSVGLLVVVNQRVVVQVEAGSHIDVET